MLSMAEKKKRRKPDPSREAPVPTSATPPAGRSGEPINVWVRSEIMAALRKYLASTKPRVTKTAAVEEALEAFLSQKGFPVPAPEVH